MEEGSGKKATLKPPVAQRAGGIIQVRSRATPPLRLGERAAPTTRGGRPRTLVELRKSCGDGRHLLGEGFGRRPNAARRLEKVAMGLPTRCL